MFQLMLEKGSCSSFTEHSGTCRTLALELCSFEVKSSGQFLTPAMSISPLCHKTHRTDHIANYRNFQIRTSECFLENPKLGDQTDHISDWENNPYCKETCERNYWTLEFSGQSVLTDPTCERLIMA
uniref:Uncharacterized protein n=1 Tax=Setaria viridis TaxID=4556 RepID=A0A4U6V0P4_SETVI|nr:hypothetical protein SEVIR_4G169400v2 [Setaria viridis]